MTFQTKVYTPAANSTDNAQSRDVVGNKSDTAVVAVGTTASLMAYLKGVLNTVLAISTTQTETACYGPQTVDVDNIGHFEITIVDRDAGLVPSANITPGTYQLVRIRGGASTNIGAVTAWSKAAGRVYVDITFAAANWATDDAFKIVPQGDTSYLVGATPVYPPLPTMSGIICDISTIEGKVDVLDTNLGDPSGDTLKSITAKLGDYADDLGMMIGSDGVRDISTQLGYSAAGSASSDLSTNRTALETASLAVGGGSAAANVREGLLFRYTADTVAGIAATTTSGDSSGTFSLVNNINKQTVVELVTATRKIICGVWLDCVNLTQEGTIGIEYKVDGSTYRVVTTEAFDPATMEDAQYIDLNMGVTSDFKVTYQASVLEGAARDIPYSLIYEIKE